MQTDLERPTLQRTPKPAVRKWIPALVAFAVAVVAVAGFLVLRNPESDTAAAEDVALTFISAQNSGDVEAAVALFAPGAIVDDPFVGDSVDGYRADITWRQATGSDITIGECTTNPASQSSSRLLLGYDGVEARCSYVLENDWTRALGLSAFQGSARYRMVVEDGLIVHLIHSPDNSGSFNEAWEAFRSWLFQNHPVDVSTMYEVGETAPKKNPEALALWEQRTAEFVSAQGG